MSETENLSHTKCKCKYHVVFIPKYRRETLYQGLRGRLGEVFRSFAQPKESQIEKGHLMADHVHMMVVIPPKYAVSPVFGYIKGKSAIPFPRVYGERKRNFVGQHFWSRWYFVSTMGRDSERDPGFDPKAGARGQATGPVGVLALMSHRMVTRGGRAALETPLAVLSGPRFESHRLCRRMVILE